MQHLMLEGRLGRDAEIKTTARGRKYVSFTLAVDALDKNGEKTTNWYNVSSFQENHVENGTQQTQGESAPVARQAGEAPASYTPTNEPEDELPF